MRQFVWILPLMVLVGCGGGLRQEVFPEGSLKVIVHFPPKRVIPAEAQRVRVSVRGQGLTQPIEKVAERPSQEGGEVIITFTNVPIGSKEVTVTAEDQYGTHRAVGTGETNILAGKTTTVTIELSLTNLASVIGRTINVRTGQPAVGVTIQIGDRQGISDSNGNFVVTNVPEGERTITLSSPEYRGYSRNITVSPPLKNLGDLPILPQQLMLPPDEPEF